jgi:hypothetical protein
MDDRIIQAGIDIFVPVMEMAVISAAKYANACNRTMVTAIDMEYGMKYSAMTYIGKHSGSHFEDDSDEDSDDEDYEESEWETDEEGEEDEFTRYTGDDEEIIRMNNSFDAWDEWVPETPAEVMIKNAIDSRATS